MRGDPRGGPDKRTNTPSGIWCCSRNGRAFDANGEGAREANASRPRPPRRGVARREGFLVRLVDGIANRHWLFGFAHRTTDRLILVDRDGGARRGCAVGLHESYDGIATAYARPGSCARARRGGRDSSYLAPVDPRNSRRRRVTGRDASRSSRLRAPGMRLIPVAFVLGLPSSKRLIRTEPSASTDAHLGPRAADDYLLVPVALRATPCRVQQGAGQNMCPEATPVQWSRPSTP
jgi:hypothetical protein